MKILNLYAGIGGNRKLWSDKYEITAVESNPDIAAVYKDLYPNDKVITDDAHQYLINNYKDYDFIWSSPPCQTHSQIRYNIGFKANRIYKKVDAKYPDMNLYEEIILLKYWFAGSYVIENTIPYYQPIYDGKIIAKHIWWSNFEICDYKMTSRGHRGGTVESLQKIKQINISKYDLKNKRQILRNCVEPDLGKFVFDCFLESK